MNLPKLLVPVLTLTAAAVAVAAGGSSAAPPPLPANTKAPELAGQAQEGQVLETDAGRWSGGGSLAFTYQWNRCDSAGVNCAAIAGATDRIYAIGSADVGKTIRASVAARNTAGSSSPAVSSASGQVSAAPSGAGRNVSLPVIKGKTQHGQTLVAGPGTWTGTFPVSFKYRWRRCGSDGGGCSWSQSGQTYGLSGSDVGRRLRVLVEARSHGSSSFALSDPSGKVTESRPTDQGAPKVTGQPSVSGTPQEGDALTANPGSWSGSQPISFSYQWQRCDGNGSNCFSLAGARDRLYTVRREDVGRRLRVLVTASNTSGRTLAITETTNVVSAAPGPQNTALPSIRGTTQQGAVLTADTGSWTGPQPQFSFRWRRCDMSGGGCTDVQSGGQTYTLTSSDVGHTLRVVVTATASGGSNSAVSNATGVIQGAAQPPPPPPPPSGSCISITSVSLPTLLLVDQVQFSPSTIHSRMEPLVARFHVTTTKGGCVSGAIVYAVGVPFDRLSAEPEVATGSDGWATISFQILPSFELKHGNLVVVFVRARKPGENLLSGVSTRRLIAVRIA
jgi:hypothetical protein